MNNLQNRNIFKKKPLDTESIFIKLNKNLKSNKTTDIKSKDETVDKIDFSGQKNEHKKKTIKEEPINKEPNIDFTDLKITKIETDKNKIKQRFLMQHNIIAKHPGVSLFVGSIGSGKTTLVNNLLSKAQFYGRSKETSTDGSLKPYFDTLFLLSGSNDDMYDSMIQDGIIKEQHIKFDPTPQDIQRIIDVQTDTINKIGLIASPKVLIILEDLVDNHKLLNSRAFRSLFIKPRQSNFSVWMLAQYMNLIPKALRQQAVNLYIFQQNRAGEEVICDQFCPANLKKNEFLRLIQQATSVREGDTHPFLNINRRVKKSERFRRNLDTIINI